MVKNTFLKAFEARNRPAGLTFHSDQGVQCTAYEFRKLLRELGVRQSLSNPGIPHDNAVAESFFSTLKREELSRKWYDSVEELEETIREHIEFYNLKVVRPRRMPEAVKTDSGCYWKTIWKNLYRCGLTLEGSCPVPGVRLKI